VIETIAATAKGSDGDVRALPFLIPVA